MKTLDIKKNARDGEMYDLVVVDPKPLLGAVIHTDIISFIVGEDIYERLDGGEEVSFKLVEVED